MKKAFYFLIIILVSSPWVNAQNLLPPIQNYRIFDYKAASKNWGLTVDDNGELFSANNQGLLHFNGEEWILYKLPHETTIRSVSYIDDKIYSGSYEEFGYWQKNGLGELEYNSLTHLIEDHEFTNEEFWQILPHENGLFFRSFSSIYRYEEGEITVIDVNEVVSKIASFQNKIIVAAGDGALFWLNDTELTSLDPNELLKGKTIIDLVQTDEGLLVGTKLNGCYLLKSNELVPWHEQINDELKLQQLNNILQLNSGRLVFGTIKNGIYLYETETGNTEKLNRETGLQNNTVLSMLQFDEQLWVGLDNGIDRIQLNSPITYFTDNSGVLGTVYDIAVHKGIVYLGSNTGIYYFENDKLQFVNGTQGHVWDLEVLEGDLFGGHNTGTFQLLDGEIVNFYDYSGGYQFAKVPDQQRTYLQGTYNGFVKFYKQDSNEWQVTKIREMDRPVEQLCFENKNTIWAAHAYKGFYRIKIDKDYGEVESVNEYNTDSIPDNYNIELFNIKNQIVFNNEGKWSKYDPILDRIVDFKEFDPYKSKQLLYYNEEHFWFLGDNESKELVFANFKGDDLIIAEPQLTRRLVPEAQNIIKGNDSIYHFTLGDGFGTINLSKLQSHLSDKQLPIPKLSMFSARGIRLKIDSLPLAEIDFIHSNNMQFKVTASSEVDARYYYKLTGEFSQMGYLDSGKFEFQNLSYGDYVLSVSTVGIDNTKSEPLEVSFTIAPPWYLSKFSLFTYLLAALAIVLLVRQYNRRKLQRKQKELEKRLLREQSEKLAQLEKEKLAKEIKLKQNELTLSAMSVAEKNELLLELKSMLVMSKDQFSNQQRYRSFMKKLDNSIHGDEDWKRFEYNFNELHNDFFENLLKRYPKLTPKDLKLCAYLKMNLSTKEIAPLMAISVRGVEIHRYRLRKKIQIDSSENISKFLITFK